MSKADIYSILAMRRFDWLISAERKWFVLEGDGNRLIDLSDDVFFLAKIVYADRLIFA